MEKTLPAGAPPKWLGSRGEELKNIVSLLGEGFVKCRANLYNAETNPDVSTQIKSSFYNNNIGTIIFSRVND